MMYALSEPFQTLSCVGSPCFMGGVAISTLWRTYTRPFCILHVARPRFTEREVAKADPTMEAGGAPRR